MSESKPLPSSEAHVDTLSSRSDHSTALARPREVHPSNDRHFSSAFVSQHSKELQLAPKDATNQSSHDFAPNIKYRYPFTSAEEFQQVRKPYSTTPGSTSRDLQGLELPVRNENYKPPEDGWLDSNPQLVCPSHGQAMRLSASTGSTGSGLNPMDRFFSEDASQQYAIYERPDNGEISTRKACRCAVRASKDQVDGS